MSTDRQTDKLTNATKNITSFAKEVIMVLSLAAMVLFRNRQASLAR